jgi:tetratricopeptide (TPR) repeat protein
MSLLSTGDGRNPYENDVIVLVTRLELFLRSRGIPPIALAKKTVHSRQHLLRLRLGESLPTRRCILATTGACEVLAAEPVVPETLFESADAMLATRRGRLSELHGPELSLLDSAVGAARPGEIATAIHATAVVTETAAAYLLRAARIAQPAAAAEIFTAARAMASSLADTPPELVAAFSAEALKGRADALRHLARFEDALSDLATATTLYTEARYCENEAGQVDYTRAGVLYSQERWGEAVIAARSARGRFLAAHDRRRAAHAEIFEGCVRFEEGDIDGARKLFHQLRETLRQLRDSEALASVWANLAACEIRRGDTTSARHWLTRANAASGGRVEGVLVQNRDIPTIHSGALI